MNRWLRVLLALAACWCLLVETAECVAGRLFGMELDGDWFLLAVGSSSSAMGEFLSLYAWPLGAALAVVVAVATAIFLLALKAPRKYFTAFALAFLAYVGWSCRSPAAARGWKPLYVAWDTVRGARRYAEIVRAGEWTPDRAAAAAAATAPVDATNVVFVIGESMTCDRLSFFGYARHTMPRIEALGAAVAISGPYRAWSPYTVNSLAALFIDRGESAAVRYRRAGYRTAFVTSHNRWTRYCSVEFAVFAACERRIYLTEEFKGEHIYDDMLLPYVKELLAADDGRPFCLFVHLMGSHFPPAARTRADYLADSGLDDFDRSVRFTDETLAAIIAALPPRTTLVYMPDHGESTDRDGWRDFASPALWSVPLMVYPASAAVPPGINIPSAMTQH